MCLVDSGSVSLVRGGKKALISGCFPVSTDQVDDARSLRANTPAPVKNDDRKQRSVWSPLHAGRTLKMLAGYETVFLKDCVDELK